MTDKKVKKEFVEFEGLPKVRLTETADPQLFLDKDKGELYILVKGYYGSSYLKKLNEGGA